MSRNPELKMREIQHEVRGLEHSHNELVKMVEILFKRVEALGSLHKEDLNKLKAEKMKKMSENAQQMQNMMNNSGMMNRMIPGMGGMNQNFMPQSVKKTQIDN